MGRTNVEIPTSYSGKQTGKQMGPHGKNISTMTEHKKYLLIHPDDNLLVALETLREGTEIEFGQRKFILRDTVRAKHKFTLHPLKKDDFVYMYGVKVGLVN